LHRVDGAAVEHGDGLRAPVLAQFGTVGEHGDRAIGDAISHDDIVTDILRGGWRCHLRIGRGGHRKQRNTQ
jgi:hypothetical protein